MSFRAALDCSAPAEFSLFFLKGIGGLFCSGGGSFGSSSVNHLCFAWVCLDWSNTIRSAKIRTQKVMIIHRALIEIPLKLNTGIFYFLYMYIDIILHEICT